MFPKFSNLPWFILSLFLASCMASKTTYKVKDEKVEAKINELKPETELLAYNNMKPQVVKSRGIEQIAGPAISLAAEGVKKLIAMDAKKYTAQYTAAVNENYFYSQPSKGESALDPRGIKFNGIRIARYFGDKVDKKKEALFLSLKVDQADPANYDLINNSLFRLKLDEFRMPYFKCKVPQSKWFMPWTWFYKNQTTANIDIDITIRSSWMTKDGVFYDKIEIGKFSTQFHDFPLDTIAQKKYIEHRKSIKNGRLEGYSMLVPRSFGYYYDTDGTLTECYGQGLYSVTMEVRESSKQHFVTKVLEDNSGTLIDSGAGSLKTKYNLK